VLRKRSPEVFVLDVDIAPFAENAAFDLERMKQYPGAESGAVLGAVMRARGLETVTADVYLGGPLRTRPAVCASVELTRFTDELLTLDHVDPAVCISLESPIVARDFYSRIDEVSQRFRHVFLWKGAHARATGRAVFHEVHWPYPDLAPAAPALPWGERRFLALVNSNKRVFAFPRPLFQPRHPRHSLRMLLPPLRVQRARFRDRWFWSELYKERLAAIRHFARCPDFDLYGHGWSDVSGLATRDAAAVSRSYRGELPALGKREALSRYRFAICFENTRFAGYVTEKVFDALAAGCIPVYLGAPDIEQYVPEGVFVDARRFRSYGALEKRLRGMASGEAEWRLAAARTYLASSAADPFRQRRHVAELAAALIGEPA